MRFDTLLIANRGEIALRIIKTAKRLGIKTVAVYSDADIEALHVREADMAVHIGPADAVSSYRNGAVIIDACKRSGAQAIHPGYGFLAENAEFAQAVLDAGLVFVGPSPTVIDLMGNKLRAKVTMEEAGVPVVPGASIQDDEAEVIAAAARIGYPLIFKATAGGGGRGMRVAENESTLLTSFAAARSEALNSFGSCEIIMERAIQQGRHIEIQVLCDEYGNAIHLGERDCSMQRRFQKVIEEAPSPAVSQALRERMGEVARTACQAIGYVGVGTLEFLLDQDGAFYFMEMNTRLQVEHGVTELITGIDLVEQQLRVAQGETLNLTQDDILFQGHAIELRICAENPEAGFLPQVGVVQRWRAPETIRVDTFLEDGVLITPYYDSMMAKFLAYAPDRSQAIQKLSHACSQTVLLGIANNLAFLQQALIHPVFREGKTTTQFLEKEDYAGTHWQRTLSIPALLVSAFVLSDLCDTSASHERKALGLRPQHLLHLQYEAANGEVEKRSLRIKPVEHGYSVQVAATKDELAHSPELQIELVKCGAGEVACVVDGIRHKVAIASINSSTVWVQDEASAWCVSRQTKAAKADEFIDGTLFVRAPMTGKVIAVPVTEGDVIDVNQTLLVVESMKMEMPISIMAQGAVGKINTVLGQQISAGQLLMEIRQL